MPAAGSRARRAARPGATSMRATTTHHLAATGGVVSSTGVAGLTLGGGLGWLMGVCGLAVDNLRSIQVVTANGHVVNASAVEAPDLFWAMRGGGGNFGVATSFEFGLHPIGPTCHRRPHRASLRGRARPAASLSRRHRHLARRAHDVCRTRPFSRRRRPSLRRWWPATAGRCPRRRTRDAAAQGVRRAGHGCLRSDRLRSSSTRCSMPAIPRGALNYWKSSFLTALSDEAIDTMVDCYARCPSAISHLLLEHFHGAATRVPDPRRRVRTARRATTSWSCASGRSRPTPRAASSGRATPTEAMRPFMGATRYVNYLNDDEGDDPASCGVRSELPALAGNQDEVRSDERVPPEPEHSAGVTPGPGVQGFPGSEVKSEESGQTALHPAAALLCNDTMTDRATPADDDRALDQRRDHPPGV